MGKKVNEILKKHYYEPGQPGAYSGAKALQRRTKLGAKIVKDWLSHQDAYTLHKPVVRKFKRRPIVTGGIDHQFQTDLIDMRSLKRENDGYAYLVTCIDAFSKYAWAIPITSKTGKALVAAVNEIFTERQPIALQSDKGSEFLNKTFQKFLKDKGVHFFTTENEDIKASIVERFNRTLKEKMWRYFTKVNNLRYIDVLGSLVRNYNNSHHRSIRMAPTQVNLTNQEQVWKNLYEKSLSTNERAVFQEGDRVRLALARQAFKKGYTPAWTEELFTVSRIQKTKPVTYVLKDDSGEELRGSFYKEELQKVGDKQVYRIESILNERRVGARKEYLVKWYGYDSSFNSWISSEHVSRYRD